jgi:signal peptidase
MTVLRRGLDLALAALVAAVLLVGLTAYLAPAFGGRALAIRSGSMAPAIGVGALIVAASQDPATLRVGDVVSVQLAGGTILTHRIDAIVQQDDRRMFRLRGDANPAPDPVLVTQDQLRGHVAISLPLLGFLLALMSMPSGVLSLLSIGGTLLAAAWLVDELGEADDLETSGERPRRRYAGHLLRGSR